MTPSFLIIALGLGSWSLPGRRALPANVAQFIAVVALHLAGIKLGFIIPRLVSILLLPVVCDST